MNRNVALILLSGLAVVLIPEAAFADSSWIWLTDTGYKKDMQSYVKTAYPCWYSIGESNTVESVPKPVQEGGWEAYPGEVRVDGRSPVKTPRL